jgi:signal transduction histidine kinase/ligand-binding sensor domain-containing protein
MLTRFLGSACLPAFVLLGIGVVWESCGGSPRGLAVEPDYVIKSWQTEDGLPQNSVNTVLQTRLGYVWLGTFNGLVRFDGIRFTVFDTGNTPELQTSRITSLFEDAHDRLWIGHETGDITRYEVGAFHAMTNGTKLSGTIVGFGEDEQGDIWALDGNGLLLRLRDGLSFRPREDVTLAGSTIGFAKGREGSLWALRSGELSELRQGTPVAADLSGQATRFAKAICASRSGGLWVVIESHVRKWTDGTWGEDLGKLPFNQRVVTCLLETTSGAVAVGTERNGMYLLAHGGQMTHFSRSKGLSDDWVRSLANDLEGDLWVGTGNGGLDLLRPGKVREVAPPDHWQQRAVLSVTSSRDGGIWIGTEGAGLYHFCAGAWEHLGEEAGLTNLFVWSVLETANSQLWVGTWGGGLLRRQGDRFSPPAGLENVTTPVTALYQDGQGILWAGTGAGLLRWHEGKAQWYGREQGFPLANVRTIAKDTQGAIWCGMSGGGLCRLKDGTCKEFHKRDGLPSEFVFSLHFSADGALWMGTFGGGLARLKEGRFATVGTREGLPNNVILSIEDDGQGHFWMTSHGGLFRVDQAELDRCTDRLIPSVNCFVYDRSQGLPTVECSGGFQPVAGRTADGALWFPTRKGLVGVSPGTIKTNGIPPRVILEEASVEGRSISVVTNGPLLRIPPGHGRLEIRYVGLYFEAPEKVRFKHRLDGLESDWVDAGESRTANYGYLPPGDYTFHVTACNQAGLWDPAEASLSIKVLPHFWQTWWFRILCGALALAATAGAVLLVARQRMRKKLARLERQQAVERERARIARDIHDDLGANLTRITMLSQSAHDEHGLPEQTAAYLQQIDQTARDLTRAMDEIVWAVNPKHDSLNSLVAYLGKFAQDFLGPAGIACRLEVPLVLPPLPLSAESRHNLFLAFKEALNNVVKHSGATEVCVSLVPDRAGFILAIRDNGKGFAAAEYNPAAEAGPERPAARNGLSNMFRRLEKIGGGCEITSVPGAGAEVRFVFNAKRLSSDLGGQPIQDGIKTDDSSATSRQVTVHE